MQGCTNSSSANMSAPSNYYKNNGGQKTKEVMACAVGASCGK